MINDQIFQVISCYNQIRDGFVGAIGWPRDWFARTLGGGGGRCVCVLYKKYVYRATVAVPMIIEQDGCNLCLPNILFTLTSLE